MNIKDISDKEILDTLSMYKELTQVNGGRIDIGGGFFIEFGKVGITMMWNHFAIGGISRVIDSGSVYNANIETIRDRLCK